MRRELPVPATLFGIAALVSFGVGAVQSAAQDGFVDLLRTPDGHYSKAGWNHYGPGYFVLDTETGVLEAHDGMGLLWYSAKEYGDFELELEYMPTSSSSNSGVFVRVPGVPTSDDYIYASFEIQIYDDGEDIHQTGAVYDAEAPTRMASRGAGVWNTMRVRFVGGHITVHVNGEQVLDWDAEPRGKVKEFSQRGYIGLQNHDPGAAMRFRNVRVKELAAH